MSIILPEIFPHPVFFVGDPQTYGVAIGRVAGGANRNEDVGVATGAGLRPLGTHKAKATLGFAESADDVLGGFFLFGFRCVRTRN